MVVGRPGVAPGAVCALVLCAPWCCVRPGVAPGAVCAPLLAPRSPRKVMHCLGPARASSRAVPQSCLKEGGPAATAGAHQPLRSPVHFGRGFLFTLGAVSCSHRARSPVHIGRGLLFTLGAVSCSHRALHWACTGLHVPPEAHPCPLTHTRTSVRTHAAQHDSLQACSVQGA